MKKWIAAVLLAVLPALSMAAGPRVDFNGDGKGDLVVYNPTGFTEMVLMNGLSALSITALTNPDSNSGWYVMGAADFNADGKSDLLWYNFTNGATVIQFMNGSAILNSVTIRTSKDWVPIGTGKFDTSGLNSIVYYSKGTNKTRIDQVQLGVVTKTSVLDNAATRAPVGFCDFDNDGMMDIVWYERPRHSFTSVDQYYITKTTSDANGVWEYTWYPLNVGVADGETAGWNLAGLGSFDGSTNCDMLWRNKSNNTTQIWLMNGFSRTSKTVITTPATSVVMDVDDFDGDGKADIIWQKTGGSQIVKEMNGTAVKATGTGISLGVYIESVFMGLGVQPPYYQYNYDHYGTPTLGKTYTTLPFVNR